MEYDFAGRWAMVQADRKSVASIAAAAGIYAGFWTALKPERISKDPGTNWHFRRALIID